LKLNSSATHVPVGEDQSQHLELARSLARQFNKTFQTPIDTFNEPETVKSILPNSTTNLGDYPRIAYLINPTKKMSKTDIDKSKILITTPPHEIRERISRALTDCINEIYASPERPGVTNLLRILAAFENRRMEDIEEQVKHLTMREFKEKVAEAIVDALVPIQARYAEVKDNADWLEKVRKDGNEKARQVASERIKQIKKAVGLL
jgi:tryptophanyl-tRNA synthetase